MPRGIFCALLLGLLLLSCGQSPTPTPQACLPMDYTPSKGVVRDDMPLRFPLDKWQPDGSFQMHRDYGAYYDKYHAAEDCSSEPGMPVYAIAGGKISYSGPMDGYGWLIIIDHPQHNLYSLYGHLSSRRWRKEDGGVEKGDLIAYIGNTDENGSSPEYGQMHPHLHFGLRRGQRIDYPRSGDTRWMAGWTYTCPESLGWLAPSRFIEDFNARSNVPSREVSATGLGPPP